MRKIMTLVLVGVGISFIVWPRKPAPRTEEPPKVAPKVSASREPTPQIASSLSPEAADVVPARVEEKALPLEEPKEVVPEVETTSPAAPAVPAPAMIPENLKVAVQDQQEKDRALEQLNLRNARDAYEKGALLPEKLVEKLLGTYKGRFTAEGTPYNLTLTFQGDPTNPTVGTEVRVVIEDSIRHARYGFWKDINHAVRIVGGEQQSSILMDFDKRTLPIPHMMFQLVPNAVNPDQLLGNYYQQKRDRFEKVGDLELMRQGSTDHVGP